MLTYSGIILLLVFSGISLVTGKRLVCYYSNWAQYRVGLGRFTTDNVDPYLCTHVIYAYAKLNGNQLAPIELNDEMYYQRMINLKSRNPNLKVLLAVGGWGVGSKAFTKVSSQTSNRIEFTHNAIQYLRKHNFDGLDFHWMYPTSKGSPAGDKYDFAELIARLISQLLLIFYINDRNLDFITMMTYDFHGAWEKNTGHNSPLFQRLNEKPPQSYSNVNWAARYWTSKGIPPSKLNIGIPTFGRGFTLASRMIYGPSAPAIGPSPGGIYTREPGYLAYYEVCKLIQKGGHVYRMNDAQVPYVVIGNQWVGYDDIKSVINKANYVQIGGYGGVGVWTLALDDFSGSCGSGKYPLISAIKNAFRN
uniref:GH18 domain-containing protein n=2 Tax=Octopus bimaculoides TaxID=37653 RepID=A0A0L8GXT8_OCTBM